MTQEEKARAYDDALKKAKEIYNRGYYVSGDIEHIFPELKESDDEKIRKALITFFNRFPYDSIESACTNAKEAIAWLEKQGEQKPADKVEPKFKVGDWINGYYTNYKVLSVNNKGYVVEDVYGNKINILFENEKFHHLWSIEDAKDGDVLVDSYSKDSIIILYKGIYKERSILAHCGWNGYNLSIKTNGLGYGGLDNTNYLPATKEQRDLLFAKMEEAGYEWDAEKLELKKYKPVEKKEVTGSAS